MSINRVVLTGRITRDVDLRATSTGTNVASFSIAVDMYSRDAENNTNQQASFINCVAWNNSAKFVSDYCKKGTLVAIEGRLQSRSYDRRDGTKAYITEVMVDRIEIMSSPNAKDVNSDNRPVSQQVPNEQSGFSIEENESDDSSELTYSDDDLPF